MAKTSGDETAIAKGLVSISSGLYQNVLHEGAVDVSLSGEPGFYRAMTDLGAAPEGLIDEAMPLDDSLASVFGYLVG